MRPFTDVGYEGRANIFSAFSLAVSPEASGRGTMIAFNDRIVSAHWASKYHANAPDAFNAVEQGKLGMFGTSRRVFLLSSPLLTISLPVPVNHMPAFYNTPSLPVGKVVFPIQHIEVLPKVSFVVSSSPHFFSSLSRQY